MKLKTLEAYINDYGKDVYSFCLYLTHNRQNADDLYQDTFLKMMEIREKLELSKNPKSYLLSVAVHIWKNSRRKESWRQKVVGYPVSVEDMPLEIADEADSPEERCIDGEERILVRRAVKNLPDKYKLPILLFYMKGYGKDFGAGTDSAGRTGCTA